jgi:hypothetical protein
MLDVNGIQIDLLRMDILLLKCHWHYPFRLAEAVFSYHQRMMGNSAHQRVDCCHCLPFSIDLD